MVDHHPKASDALYAEFEGLAVDEIRYAVSVQQESAFHGLGDVDVRFAFSCICRACFLTASQKAKVHFSEAFMPLSSSPVN
jgi:hypothetical protein